MVYKMNTRLLTLSSILLFIAGCASNPAAEKEQAVRLMAHKIEIYGPACEKLGYKAETDAWRECIQNEYGQAIARQQRQLDYLYWNPYRGVPPYYYRR
jgi:hypothetical protein